VGSGAGAPLHHDRARLQRRRVRHTGPLRHRRALNADDTRLIANTWYAILGITVQTVSTTVALSGPDWGGQKIGLPAGALTTDSSSYFVDQSLKWGVPLIPCFNSNNQGNINVFVADGEASTSPKIDFLMYGLTGKPGF
jgi:hypothetical protein